MDSELYQHDVSVEEEEEGGPVGLAAPYKGHLTIEGNDIFPHKDRWARQGQTENLDGQRACIY